MPTAAATKLAANKQTVIRGEDQQEFDTFQANMLRDLSPNSAIESLLAERIVAAAWRLKRFSRVESAFFNNRIDAILEANPDTDPDAALASLFTDPAEAARMRLFLRYQTAVQREYDTAIRELQKAKKVRTRQCVEDVYKEALLAPPARPAVGFASQNAIEPETPLVAMAAASPIRSKIARDTLAF